MNRLFPSTFRHIFSKSVGYEPEKNRRLQALRHVPSSFSQGSLPKLWKDNCSHYDFQRVRHYHRLRKLGETTRVLPRKPNSKMAKHCGYNHLDIERTVHSRMGRCYCGACNRTDFKSTGTIYRLPNKRDKGGTSLTGKQLTA